MWSINRRIANVMSCVLAHRDDPAGDATAESLHREQAVCAGSRSHQPSLREKTARGPTRCRQTNKHKKQKEGRIRNHPIVLYCIVLHCTLLIFLRQSEGKSQEFQWRRGWIDGWCAGLWNTYINRESAEDGSPTLFTFGAMSDSAVSLIESSAVRHENACARAFSVRLLPRYDLILACVLGCVLVSCPTVLVGSSIHVPMCSTSTS